MKVYVNGGQLLVYNKRFNIPPEIQTGIIVYAIAVLISEKVKDFVRKKAAIMVLIALIPEWESIIPKDERIFDRRDKEVRAWKMRVLERDGHKCTQCGSMKNLQVHHILEWSVAPQFRVDDDNGVTLCVDCHANEHIHERNLILSHKRNG